MKSQFILFIALVSLMLLSVNTALAAPSLSLTWITSPSDLYQGQNATISYNITNNGDSALTSYNWTLSIASLNITSTVTATNLAVNASTTGEYTILTNDSTNVGAKTVSITAAGTNGTVSNSTSLSGSFNVIYPYCEVRNSGEIRIVDIVNEDDIDGEKFYPLETIDIKLKLENTDEDDSHKVIIEVVLVQDNEEVSDTDSDYKLKIDEDNKETVTVNMTLPADLDAGDYYLYVKVYNDDDEDNCEQEVMQIEIKKSSNEVVIDNLEIPKNVSCGSITEIGGKVFNIGKNDEEKVKIVYNNGFGVSSEYEFNSLDSGEDKSLGLALEVPKNATEGVYSIKFDIYYEYDEDDEIYETKDSITRSFKVLGDCQQLISSQTITTEASTALSGVESEVRVTITNTGTVSQTFTTTATAEWAEIGSITPASVTLAAGEQKEIIIKLEAKPSTDIGAHDMLVTVQHGGTSESKTVSVNVQKSSAKAGLIEQLKFQLKYNPTWVIIDTVLVIGIIATVVLLLSNKKN